jgi:hypothetical protein
MKFIKKIALMFLLSFLFTQTRASDLTNSDIEMISLLADFKSGKIDLPTTIKKLPKDTMTKDLKETNFAFMIFRGLPRADRLKWITFSNNYPKLMSKFLLVCMNITESILKKRGLDLNQYKSIKKTVIHELNTCGFGIAAETSLEKLPVTSGKRKEAKAMMKCIAHAFENVIMNNQKITSIIPADMKEQLEDNLELLKKVFIHDDIIEAICEYLHHTDLVGLHNLIKNSTFIMILHGICNLIPKKIFEGTKMLIFDDTKSLAMTCDDLDALDDLIDIDFEDFDLDDL